MSRRNTLVLVALITAATVAFVPGAETTVVPAGSIQGEVVLNVRPPRRSASRYPGAGTGAHAIQEIPAVAYLEGDIGGVSVSPRSDLEVAQSDTAFTPAVLVVPLNSEVEFPNRDSFFHNVFSYSRTERFDLGRYPQGASKSVVFDSPGVVAVYCEVHEFMRSAVIVVENPFHAVVSPDGSFAISGVPAGTYTLVVWHADLGEKRESVTVRDGAVTRVSTQLGG